VKESSKKSSTKDMKQWLSLFGEEANRAKTKVNPVGYIFYIL
jgi:hypothetical protein